MGPAAAATSPARSCCPPPTRLPPAPPPCPRRCSPKGGACTSDTSCCNSGKTAGGAGYLYCYKDNPADAYGTCDLCVPDEHYAATLEGCYPATCCATAPGGPGGVVCAEGFGAVGACFLDA